MSLWANPSVNKSVICEVRREDAQRHQGVPLARGPSGKAGSIPVSPTEKIVGCTDMTLCQYLSITPGGG